MKIFGKAQSSCVNASTCVEGSLTVRGDLDVFGQLKGGRIEVAGEVILHDGAEASGTLKCQVLTVESGARFSGPAAIGSVPNDILKRYGPGCGYTK